MIVEELIMVQHHMAQSVSAGREIDERLGNELEAVMIRLVHTLKACQDSITGLSNLWNLKLSDKQFKLVCNAAMAEFADEAIALWDRYKQIWKLEACWNKEVSQ